MGPEAEADEDGTIAGAEAEADEQWRLQTLWRRCRNRSG